MIPDDTRKILEELVEGELYFDEPMKNHTSLQIGGPAEALLIPKDELDLKKLLSFCRKEFPVIVIGNGTKLLVSDEGIDGIVIKMSECFDSMSVSRTKVEVGAGLALRDLSKSMVDHKLSGLEFAVGIPGTVGGAVVMNAGAHGSMISDVVTNVALMDFDGNISKCQKNDIFFGYRQSEFQSNPSIILSVEMNLRKNDLERIRGRMNKHSQWRKTRQPQNVLSAGSIFKNPAGSSAGELIDKAGLKGTRIGNAKISEEHANFILNLGNATAQDVINLMKKAQKEVLRKFNTMLEPEIRILGRLN